MATPELRHVVIVGAESSATLLSEHLEDVPVQFLPDLLREPSIRHESAAYRWVSRRLSYGDIDLVHTHQSKAGLHGRLAAWHAGIPAVHSLSMANSGEGFGSISSIGYRNAERFLARHTRQFAVVGRDLRDRFIRLGVHPGLFTIIRSSIDLEQFETQTSKEKAATALGINRAPGVVAYVGRFERLKGVEELPALLTGLNRLLGATPTLLLAGDGPLLPSVVAKCEQASGDGQILALGHTHRVPEVIAAADVVVLLSRCEGLPQVLVQALASSCPFAAYAADGTEELARLPGVGSCSVVEIGDLSGLTWEVARLVSTPTEPTTDLTEWSPENVHRQYRHFYQHALDLAPKTLSL